jgi:flagellar biosynthesis/type III secretory pathway M-ring protein FliF/YscJ
MDFLKAQITRIQEQLAGLSATQKMLVFCLLTIMVMTLVWWSRWAAEPEMSPLLDQSLTTEDIGQISANLDARDIPHTVNGDKVLVPADRKMEILATLGYSNALPKDFDKSFDSIIKEMNWLDPPDKTAEMFLRAREQTLSAMMRNWPGVSDAEVVIDPHTDRDIGSNDAVPVATVTLTTGRDDQMSARQLAQSAAAVVCGAQAGLLRSNVNVVIDGVSYPVKDHTDQTTIGDDGDPVQMQKNWEDLYTQKIENSLSDIHGLFVSVTVKLDTSLSRKTIHTVDPKQIVSVPTKTEETNSETTAEPAASQDPGAVSNTALSLPSSGGGGGGNTSSSDSTELKADYSNTDEQVTQEGGMATVESASIRVPRSYFVDQYKNENDGKDPDDPATFKAFIDDTSQKIHNVVKGCAVFPTDDALVVEEYSDAVPPELPLGQQAAASPLNGIVTKHSKELGIGVLAVVSLFMVSMMARKGAVTPALAQGMPEADPQTLKSGETVVGNAAENSATLDGMELDDETVKAQQMVDQVQQMVSANPEAAANLVKRWLNR